MMRRPPRSTRTDTRLPYPTRCRAAPSQDRAMPDASSGLARTAQIVRFLLKYRSAGVFTGLDLDAASPSPEPPPTEGKPEDRSEEHTSELQSLMRTSYAVFCLKNKSHQQYSTNHCLTELIPKH